MVEISGERRENEVVKSEKVGVAIEERENDDGVAEAELAVAVAERNSAANRWPKQETMALLRIRSEMDFAFRDTGFKAHLWDEISRYGNFQSI